MKTDKELHLEFLKLGTNRRKLTNELLALLPEIFDRKIYLKYASTIIEYAGKFGGLSKGVVIKRLRLEKYLSDKPFLREAIKTEGVHKVALVANIATPETEEAWVDKLKNMSKNAIQELSKEVRNAEMEAKNECFGEGGLFDGLGKRDNSDIVFAGGNSGVQQMASSRTPCNAAPLKIIIEITDESAFLFLKLKKELEKASKKDSGVMRILSNKEAINEILKRLTDAEFSREVISESIDEKRENKKIILEDNFCEGEIADEQAEKNKIEISKLVPRNDSQIFQKISRYIPVYIKKMATYSPHGRCTYPNCGHPAEIFHHRERFAESKNHKSIIPLCKTHHEFAHNGIIANESQNVEQWNLEINKNNLSKSDISYRKVRMQSLK